LRLEAAFGALRAPRRVGGETFILYYEDNGKNAFLAKAQNELAKSKDE
jgi:hypothetical protein